MIEHLRKWIGLYLLGMIAIAIYLDTPDDDYPLWLWWLIVPIILWKTPPFSVGDWFWGKIGNFFMWIFTPLHRWQATWPKWVLWVWGIAMIILFEELFFAPLGYTIYPWRMDLGW